MSLTALLFMLCFAAGLGVCLFRHPVYGLYTYLAVFYLDAPTRWWGAGLPDLRWSFLAAAATFAGIILRRRAIQASQVGRASWLSHSPIVLFGIYVIWMWIQWPWVLSEEDHLVGLNYFTKYLIVIFMIYKLVDSKERVRGFFLVNSVGCFYLGYLAFQTRVSGRLDGIGGPGIDDANSLGVQMAVVFFLAAAVYLVSKSRLKWVAAATLPFILNTIILSGSRGAFLATVVAGFVFFIFRPRKQIKKIVFYGVMGVALFFYVASETFWERMGTIGAAANRTEQIDKSADSRYVIIESQLLMVREYPFGGGRRATTVLSPLFIPIEFHARQGGRSSHNTFMSALVDEGIPGFIIWLAITVLLGKYCLAIRRTARLADDAELGWLNAATASGIAVVVVGGLFFPLLAAEIFIWLLAITCSLRSISNKTQLSDPDQVIANKKAAIKAVSR